MFFSLDLLSIRGGKMNTIWLLGTLKETGVYFLHGDGRKYDPLIWRITG